MLKSLNNQTKLNNLLSIFDNKRYFRNFVIPTMETMGKNLEMVPCAICEQRREQHYNILKTT